MSLLSDFLLKQGVACAAVTPEDYRGDHKAPGPDYGAPMYDLSEMYPKDVYTGRGYEYTSSPEERAGLADVLRVHNKPWAPITIYRAVPKDVTGAKINVGDWVTTSRAYAKKHGEAHLGGKGTYKILKLIAHARDLYTAGDSLAEWGYYPREATEEEKQQVNDVRARGAQERLQRMANGEKLAGLNKYPEDPYFDKPAEFFQQELNDHSATGAVEIPDTIIVNGVSRLTHNSLGDLIHPTVQGIENFWNWFGDSKVVDSSGHPSVVYHGVGAAGKFNKFRKDLIGASSGNEGHFGKGFYFSPDKKEAKTFSEQWHGTGDVLECYLRITKPFEPTTESLWSIGKKNPHLNVPDKIPVAIDGDDVENQLMLTNPKAGRIFHILRTHPDDAWDIITKDTNGRMPSEPSSKILDILNDMREYLEPEGNRSVPEVIVQDLKSLGITPKLIYGHEHELYMPYLTDVGERGAAWTKALQAEGYDGVLGPEIVVFDESQIKSVDNTGAFDPKTTDITAATNYQDDTDYQDDHQFLTKLGLIFGQPQAFEDGIKVTYAGRELEIKEAPFETKTSEGKPASRGRKAVKPTYNYVPGILITNRHTGVSHSERKEGAEKWLRGLKAYWDHKT